MAEAGIVRWWWVRHAPVAGPPGFISGQRDVACDLADTKALAALAQRLPTGARWVTSHLSRAKDTAAHLHPDSTPTIEPLFAEQDFGDWAGLSWDSVATLDGAAAFWDAPATTAPPNGESFADVCRRVAGAIERRNAELITSGGDIVAVAHAGPIRAALALALALPAERALALDVANLSLSRLDHLAGDSPRTRRGGHWRVVGHNLL